MQNGDYSEQPASLTLEKSLRDRRREKCERWHSEEKSCRSQGEYERGHTNDEGRRVG